MGKNSHDYNELYPLLKYRLMAFLDFPAVSGFNPRVHRKDVLFDLPPGPRGRRPTPDSAMRPRAQNCLEDRTTALFDNLSEKLGGILDKLTGRGALSEKDVDAAMREVRRALLEADVSLDVPSRWWWFCRSLGDRPS